MALKKKQEAAAGSPGWLVLYTSLIVILVAFFVLLNSMALQDQESVKKAIGSLRGSFGVLSGGFKTSTSKEPTLDFSSMEIEKNKQTVNSFMQKVIELFRLVDVHRINVEKEGTNIRINIPSNILFVRDSAQIQETSKPILDKFTQELRKIDSLISIAGHTSDSVVQTVEFPSNWELSIKRAVRIAEFFQKNGIYPERMKVLGYSMYKPLRNYVKEYDKSLQDRVEIMVNFNSEKDSEKYGKEKGRDKTGSFEVDADLL
jgi:chemotaxis protein MotB